MERITDDQVQRLLTFTAKRTRPTRSPATEDADRTALALRTAVLRLSAAVRFHRTATPDTAADTEVHATGCWNLLVDLAKVWRDHPDFPDDAAVETFDFTDDSPSPSPPPDPIRRRADACTRVSRRRRGSPQRRTGPERHAASAKPEKDCLRHCGWSGAGEA